MSQPIGRTGLSRISTSFEHAGQIRLPGEGNVSWMDDFLGDVLADQWTYAEGTDTADADGAILAGGIGGVLRLTTGNAGTGLAADQAQVASFLQWQASNGGLVTQARVKLSRITDAWFFFGFTDNNALEAPVVSAGSDNTLTTNATNAVGFMFDTRMAADNMWLVGVASDTDAIAQNSLVAPEANEYVTLRVEVNANGHAAFYVNGQQVGEVMTGAVTPAADLTPYVGVGNLSGTSSFTCDVDYIFTGMARGANGTST